MRVIVDDDRPGRERALLLEPAVRSAEGHKAFPAGFHRNSEPVGRRDRRRRVEDVVLARHLQREPAQ